ncbi:flavin reductase family protein [Azorhizobium doebereinerae]|uniref:flavin reductase family protein n=1 Tax=Azorhizobium doebereinerae TaxID=281091 RepID=UPI000409991B|nr:flavin reductase family protein [Azorhizobium doebereinerae]
MTTADLSFDFADVHPDTRYKLLTGLVVPRPIAWVVTKSTEGVVNAAPFSLFNVISEDPPLVVFSVDTKPGDRVKDTLVNVHATRAFVVNLVDAATAQAMNNCAIPFPPEEGEPEALGIPLVPGTHGPVPRLAIAPVAMECRQVTTLNFGPRRDLVIGEVLALHTRAGVLDPKTLRTDYDVYQPVGRMGGTMYAHLNDRFSMERESYDEFRARMAKEPA